MWRRMPLLTALTATKETTELKQLKTTQVTYTYIHCRYELISIGNVII